MRQKDKKHFKKKNVKNIYKNKKILGRNCKKERQNKKKRKNK